jgi:biopolymer transport protein ExbD
MVGAVQKENAHNTKLPGTEPSVDVEETPDEIAIRIEDDGQVYLNEDPLDTPEAKLLPQLTANLTALQQSAKATNSQVLVTIYANELAKYQRVVEVLDALTRAEISNVTFQAGAPE